MDRPSESEEMVHYPLRIRKDQKEDLEKLKDKGWNPAQLIRIGLDRELDKMKAKED